MKKSVTSAFLLVFVAMSMSYAQGTWKEYRDEVNTGLIRGGNIMSYFTEAPDGSIWASNTTGSLVRINEDEITIYEDLKRSIAAQTNIGVIVDVRERSVGVWWESAADVNTGWTWFVSNRGIALWDGNVLLQATNELDDKGRMIFYAESNEKNYIIEEDETVELPSLSKDVKDPLINMYSVMVDSKGVAWFGGFKGRLYSIDRGVWKVHDEIENYKHEGINEKSKSILTIYEDKDGRIWFVSGAAITKHVNGEFIFQDELPILDNANDIAEDKYGHLWTADKNGVYRYDNEQWETVSEDYEFETIYTVGNIETDKDGTVWYLTGTNAMFTKPGYLYRYDGEWQKFEFGKKSLLMDMMIDDKDRVWVCETRGVYVHEGGEWILMKDCSAMKSFNKIFQDSQGRIWCGRGSFKGEIDMYTE